MAGRAAFLPDWFAGETARVPERRRQRNAPYRHGAERDALLGAAEMVFEREGLAGLTGSTMLLLDGRLGDIVRRLLHGNRRRNPAGRDAQGHHRPAAGIVMGFRANRVRFAQQARRRAQSGEGSGKPCERPDISAESF